MSRDFLRGRRVFARSVCLSLLISSLAAPAAMAQGPETLKALAAYRLTMPTIRKLLEAGDEVEKTPAEAKAVREATSDIQRMSIGQTVAVIEKYPAMKRAVARTGLSSREYATGLLSLHWAMRYLAEQEMRKAQGQTPPGPPAHVPKENVELVLKNMEEIERLSQK